MQISDEYTIAVLAGQISAITTVGRRKGKMTSSGIRKWHDHGLTIVVDDPHFTMAAVYKGELVAASLRDRCIFKDGSWFNIVLWYEMEIEEEDQRDYQKQCRETAFRLMERKMN